MSQIQPFSFGTTTSFYTNICAGTPAVSAGSITDHLWSASLLSMLNSPFAFSIRRENTGYNPILNPLVPFAVTSFQIAVAFMQYRVTLEVMGNASQIRPWQLFNTAADAQEIIVNGTPTGTSFPNNLLASIPPVIMTGWSGPNLRDVMPANITMASQRSANLIGSTFEDSYTSVLPWGEMDGPGGGFLTSAWTGETPVISAFGYKPVEQILPIWALQSASYRKNDGVPAIGEYWSKIAGMVSVRISGYMVSDSGDAVTFRPTNGILSLTGSSPTSLVGRSIHGSRHANQGEGLSASSGINSQAPESVTLWDQRSTQNTNYFGGTAGTRVLGVSGPPVPGFAQPRAGFTPKMMTPYRHAALDGPIDSVRLLAGPLGFYRESQFAPPAPLRYNMVMPPTDDGFPTFSTAMV